MDRLTENKIILVVADAADDLVARFNTEAQARFYVEHLGADFMTMPASTRATGSGGGRTGQLSPGPRCCSGPFCPTLLWRGRYCGRVGAGRSVANVLSTDRQPVVGPFRPRALDGVLLPFRLDDLPRIVPGTPGGAHGRSDRGPGPPSTGEVLYKQ